MTRSFLPGIPFAVLLCALLFAAPVFSEDSEGQSPQKQAGDISTRVTDTGARIMFTWDSQSKVAVTPEARGNTVTLHFEKPVNLTWDRTLSELHPYLKEVETKDDGKTVVLTLQCPAQAHSFLLYSKNGIDFSKNGVELNGAPAKAPMRTFQTYAKNDYEPGLPNEPVSPVKKARKKARRHLTAYKAPAAKAETASTAQELATFAPAAGNALSQTAAANLADATLPSRTAPADSAVTPAPVAITASITKQVNAATAVQPMPASQVQAIGKSNAESANDAISLSQLSPAAGETPAVIPTAAGATLPPVTPAAPPSATENAAAISAPVPVASPPSSEPSAAVADSLPPPVAVKPETKGETISLPLLANDSFAVFIKNKTLWIAAQEPATLTAEAFKSENKNLPYAVQQIAPNVLTVALNKDTNVVVTASPAGKILLNVEQDAGKPVVALVPALSTQDAKTSLAIEAAKPGKLIAVNDPATGEALSILPVSTLANGVGTARSFVEFSLLPTAQGIVVQQASDAVTVKQAKDGLEISAARGLTVSAEMKRQLDEAKADPAGDRIPSIFFPYARWKLDDEKKYVSAQLKLIHGQLSDNAEDANNARLKLLGLYLSEGLFAEANGMAGEILRNSYKFYVDHKVSALRGAANFFRYRLSEAERDFSAPELAGLPETAMWLALCAELTGKPGPAFNFKNNYEGIIRYYPPVFIQKIAVIAADKSINRKEYEAATAIFTTLQKENIDEPVRKYIDFMRAKILSETGNEDEAAKIWERQAGDVNDRLIRARAEFSLVNMYLKEEKIPVEDAAKRLEKLRIVWRGDGLELNVLSLLGSLYVEQKDYPRALRAWRDIVAYYAEVPDAITTARKMEDVFVKLYNKGGADDMPPLTALSLFYEFRDLVPAGAEGDLMIRNLAERLVKIDLLDRASQLLSHQVRNRLQGTERSRVGSRLAEIYLLNRQPKQALETLKTTGYGDLTPDIQLARIRLTAQALAQQGQLSKAIEVLSSDTSAEGNLLRLSVYWTNWDWPNVVAMAEEILSNRNDPSAALTLQESEVLLKLATAYVYEHDSGQIQYLRDYFTPLLKNNPNKNSFLFITSESGSIDYSNLSNLDTDIKTVKSFIDTSRKEATQKLSPTAAKTTAPVASAAPDAKKSVN